MKTETTLSGRKDEVTSFNVDFDDGNGVFTILREFCCET